MNDRQQTFVHIVAAALCLAGLFILLERTFWKGAKRPSALKSGNWRCWFVSGFDRLKRIYPVWLVVGAATGVGTLAMIHNVWTTTQVPPNDPRRVAFFPLPQLGLWWDEVRSLGRSAVSGGSAIPRGGSSIIPFPELAASSVIPLLLIARRRNTFPYTRSASVIRFWSLSGSFAWVLILFGWIAPFIPPLRAVIDRSIGSGGFSLFVLVTLIFLLLGFAPVLPLLYASVDTMINTRLSSPLVSLRRVFLSLAAIQLLLWIGGAPGSAISYLRGGLSGESHKILSFVDLFLGLTLVPFLLTATFLASESLSFKEIVSRNLSWWKAEFLFLFALVLGTGLAEGVESLILRGSFAALPGEGVAKVAAFYVLRAVANLAISVFSFSFLLGNWLEYESRPAVAEEAG